MKENNAKQAELDYRRIERAIRFLTERRGSQPGLEEVASYVGMSPYHFQRLFTRWAGIGPKKFLQYLTLRHAKTLLNDSRSVMDAALESGLSGPSRLHDLFVRLEAVTPGDYSRGGKELVIRYGYHPTPFGEALICVTDRGICGLSFVGRDDRGAALAFHLGKWPLSMFREDRRGSGALLEEVFSESGTPPSSSSPIPCVVKGTAFQHKVWEALLSIPPGAVTTYSAIAAAVGRADAVRAAANAVGANPIAYLIPCHRVIQSSGALGGYRWGIPRKQAMLARETAKKAPLSQ